MARLVCMYAAAKADETDEMVDETGQGEQHGMLV
jgi:hypothetical protein